jgi:hypothetical protein
VWIVSAGNWESRWCAGSVYFPLSKVGFYKYCSSFYTFWQMVSVRVTTDRSVIILLFCC